VTLIIGRLVEVENRKCLPSAFAVDEAKVNLMMITEGVIYAKVQAE
jgi:hypothetical protein